MQKVVNDPLILIFFALLRIYTCMSVIYVNYIKQYWVALIHGMGGILSFGKIWTVPVHEAKPREMEQFKFYLAVIFLPFHSESLNICILSCAYPAVMLFTLHECNRYEPVQTSCVFYLWSAHAALTIMCGDYNGTQNKCCVGLLRCW